MRPCALVIGGPRDESEGGGALPLRGESAWTKTHGLKLLTNEGKFLGAVGARK